MQRWVRAAAIGLILGLTATAPAAAKDPALAQLFEDYKAWRIAAEPIEAGDLGVAEARARLPDVSRAGQLARDKTLAAFEARAAALAPTPLDAEERLDLALLSRTLADQRRAIAFDDARLAFTNDSGFHTAFDELAAVTPIRTAADAQAWLARLEGVETFYADNIANARRGLKTRFAQPRIVVERVLAVARLQAARSADSDLLLAPIRDSSLPEAEKAAALARAEALLTGPIAKARADFVRFLEKEYLPGAKKSLAARDWAGGEDFYRWLVAYHTTTALSPDEVHEIGLKEVARIRARMDAVMAETGFNGTFAEFLAFLRTDPQFYARSREELLEKAAVIAKEADGKLPALFGRLPRLSYGVTPVPQDIEEGYTTGRYMPGSEALGRAGFYLVNTGNLPARPLYELPALTLHEAAPGHHLQIALAQELDELPWHRRTTFVTAFVEGWGLYAEYLGEEMGAYRTPYERFGRLSYEMWRACRLVADTGIHWKRWSIEEARACFTENSALAPHNIQTELERYISWPGQALGYKIGEIRLRELREKAQAALGPKFDVRRFHDAVLLSGAVPLEVLGARIDAWIAAEAART